MRGTARRGGAVWSLRARADADADGTNTKPGRNIHDEKIPEDTSVKTNSEDRPDRRCDGAVRLSVRIVGMPIFHLNV